MKRIIEVLREYKQIKCYPNERFSLGVPMFNEDDDEHNIPSHVLFEEPRLKNGRKCVKENTDSMFRYYLDGSQRFYRVIEASVRNKYRPICAGQIGVAVIERTDCNKLIIRRDLTKIENILAFPDLFEKSDLKNLQDRINETLDPKYKFRIEKYKYNPDEDSDPGDKGRAIILNEMHMLELTTIRNMIRSNLIQPHQMLLKDGGLQYRDSKFKNLNFKKDDLVQLRNVIGVAKTFSPSLTLGKGRGKEDIGNLVKDLEWKERTSVISPDSEKSNTHGCWYLRIRPKSKIYRPLQGIVKVEVFATDDERLIKGISESRADTISGYLLRERNVTPFKADSRWASHIYPVYLAETYLKSSFLGHNRFKSLIF